MMYSLEEFNKLNVDKARQLLYSCCGSSHWVDALMEQFPFENEKALFDLSREIWFDQCKESDFMEAFSHHPQIGNTKSLKEKFVNTAKWASKEQQSVKEASDVVIEQLVLKNEKYLARFGSIFIVCATGKSAEVMLQLLKMRLNNEEAEEMNIAMAEQFKITLLRIQKTISCKKPFWKASSHVTSHVLDTAKGIPGKNLPLRLKKYKEGKWVTIALGITNADGRVSGLLPSGVMLDPSNYQVNFDTASYFENQKITTFYPQVDIHFSIFDASHYHIPLLISPYGYTTYRGS